MKKTLLSISLLLGASLLLPACGKQESAPPSSGGGTPSTPAVAAGNKVAAPAKTGIQNIRDFSDVWSALYKQNEKPINDYEGMPIMELVTPPLTFANAVFYEMLNMDHTEGRHEGTLPLAGFPGFMEKKGSKLTFGSDHALTKDGMGPLSKTGDRLVESGSLDLDKKVYVAETYTERAGAKISRSYHEFKLLADGSMICIVLSGQTINMRGDAAVTDSVIYLHNGKNQYDFVVGNAKVGPAFKTLSFADKGDLTKEKALDLLKSSGYTIDKSGGIKDGKLVVDK